MSKAVRIASIIWIVLCAILAIVFDAVGSFMLANVDQIAQEMVKTDAAIKLADAQAATAYVGIVMVIWGAYFVAGIVFSIIYIVLANKKIRKGAGIALGIVGAVLGAELPGILFVVHAAKDLE